MFLDYMIEILMVGISYYIFSSELLIFTSQFTNKTLHIHTRFFCSLAIYLWFVFASFFEIPLVINWFIFMLLLGMEIHIVLDFDYMPSYALSLFSMIITLAVNTIFRSLFAIMLNVPLDRFDNYATSFKKYPIFFGFLFTGLLFLLFRRLHISEKLKLMLRYRRSLRFYLYIEAGLYLFLIIQLLAYSQPVSNMGIKVWGIKAAVFSIIALIITNIYTLRVASLQLYMDKQHDIHNQLMQEKEDIDRFWVLAYTDMLTGCNNRQLLDKRLEEYAGYGSIITLAFIDLNGLKRINDQFGHLEGDSYITTTANYLKDFFEKYNTDIFRYGGDEFVLISNSLNEEEMKSVLGKINTQLKKNTTYPYSISYGVVHGNSIDYEHLLTMADNRMYQQKMRYYENLGLK